MPQVGKKIKKGNVSHQRALNIDKAGLKLRWRSSMLIYWTIPLSSMSIVTMKEKQLL